MGTEKNSKHELLERLTAVAELAMGPEPTCADIDASTVDKELRKAKIDPTKVLDTLQELLADAKAQEDRARAARRREGLLRRSKGISRRGQGASVAEVARQYFRGLEGATEEDIRSVEEDEALLDLVEEQMNEGQDQTDPS